MGELVMTMNLYPIKTKVDGRQVRNLRLRASNRGTVVWEMDRETGDVEEFLRAEAQPKRVGASQRWTVDGYLFEPQRGCGCNHPMHTWTPPED